MKIYIIFADILTFLSLVSSQTSPQLCQMAMGNLGLCIHYSIIKQCPLNFGYGLAPSASCSSETFCCYMIAQSTTPAPSTQQCGIKGTDTRAVKIGDPPATVEFCWQVFIFQKSTGKFLGGGSLISPNSIATSASILQNIPENDLIIYAGNLQQQTTANNPCGQYIEVASVAKHPQFHSKNNYDNNVAVLKLKTPAQLNGKCVCTICLPAQNTNYDNRWCIVTGLGKNKESDPDNNVQGPVYNEKLKVTYVPVVEREKCKYLIKTYANQHYSLDDSQMCAGGLEGQDACKGDGGGPLACDRGQNIYELVGIVSSGFGCYRAGIPGIYTSVQKVQSFIVSNM